MAIKEMTRVWETSKQDSTALLILLALADAANDWGHCWPGRKHLSERGRCNQRTVTRLVQKLKEDGEIEVGVCKGHRNHYVLLCGLSDAEKEDRKKRLTLICTSDKKSPPAKKRSDSSVTSPIDMGVQGTSDIGEHKGVPDPSVKPSVKPLVVEDTATIPVENKDIFKLLHTVWGQMVSRAMEMELWKVLETDFPLDWIEDAMKEAIENGSGSKKSIKYIRAILNRWKQEGREDKRKPKENLTIAEMRERGIPPTPRENVPVPIITDQAEKMSLDEFLKRQKEKTHA